MGKRFVLCALFICLSATLINCMNDKVSSSNKYGIHLALDALMHSDGPSSTHRSSRVSHANDLKPFIKNIINHITHYYTPIGDILDLSCDKTGYKLSWSDFKYLCDSILMFTKKYPVRVINLKNNKLSSDGFPVSIIMCMLNSDTLNEVQFEGNPLCNAVNFNCLIQDFSKLLNSRTKLQEIGRFFLSGIIKLGEEQLDVQADADDSDLGLNMIIFNLGPSKKYKVQKKVVNVPTNLIKRLVPVISKLGIVVGVYLVTSLSTFFIDNADNTIDTSVCCLHTLTYLLEGCGLNETTIELLLY